MAQIVFYRLLNLYSFSSVTSVHFLSLDRSKAF